MSKAVCPNPSCIWLLNRESDVPVCCFGWCINRRMAMEKQKRKLKEKAKEMKANDG